MKNVESYGAWVQLGTSSEIDYSVSLPEISSFEATLRPDPYLGSPAQVLDATHSNENYAGATAESELQREFDRLASQWIEETKFLSSVNDIILHPSYMRIIGMGQQVLPLILRRLAQRTEFWFWALKFITGADPVTEDIRGNVQAIRQAWLDWGRENVKS